VIFILQKGAGGEVQHGLCIVPLLFLQTNQAGLLLIPVEEEDCDQRCCQE